MLGVLPIAFFLITYTDYSTYISDVSIPLLCFNQFHTVHLATPSGWADSLIVICMLIAYPVYPLFIKNKNVIIKTVYIYKPLKRIFYLVFPLAIIFIIYYTIQVELHLYNKDQFCNDKNAPKFMMLTNILMSGNVPAILLSHDTLVLFIYTVLFKILSLYARKDFRMLIAEECFKMIEKQDEVGKIRYLLMGLESYNQYLRRQLKLELKNPERIYSQIISTDIKGRCSAIAKITGSFGSDDFGSDSLKLVQTLSELSEFLHLKPETLLIKAQHISSIKDYSTVVGALLIPIVVAIIPIIINGKFW